MTFETVAPVIIPVVIWLSMASIAAHEAIRVDKGKHWFEKFVGLLVCAGWPLMLLFRQPGEDYRDTVRRVLED